MPHISRTSAFPLSDIYIINIFNIVMIFKNGNLWMHTKLKFSLGIMWFTNFFTNLFSCIKHPQAECLLLNYCPSVASIHQCHKFPTEKSVLSICFLWLFVLPYVSLYHTMRKVILFPSQYANKLKEVIVLYSKLIGYEKEKIYEPSVCK